VEVVFICEFSGGTRPSMRHATLNFADTLSRDHIQVLFVQGNKPMHKKMIIVDSRTVLLGSSNLTLAGTQYSNEINVRIRSERFARRAMADAERLRARAKPASQLN